MTDETRSKIFDLLRSHLLTLSPPLVISSDDPGKTFELMGNTPVPYGYDKKIIPGMYFGSIAHRKDSVAFYLFPCYHDPALKDLAPNLTKCLKGKTCFHFKKPEQVVETELSLLLTRGLEHWKLAGYVI